ncbi:MAG: hypothetical protein ACW7DP_13160, partial [Paraglaciecola chathamensis]
CVPVQSGGAVRLNKLTSPLPVVQPAGAEHQKASGFTLFLCLYKTGVNPSMVMESSPISR